MTLPDVEHLGDSVVLNDVELSAGGAYMIENSFELTSGAPKTRSNSRDSVGPYGRRSARQARSFDLIVLVTGAVDTDGDDAEDWLETLEANVGELQAETLDATEDEFGCIPVEVTRKSGVVLSGGIQIDDFTVAPAGRYRRVFMKATLPTGRLEPED